MTTPIVLTLLGFGLGALIVAGNRSDLRSGTTTRERAIAAQKIAARAAQTARELAESASREESR